jgi:dynein heavy chain
MLRQFIDFKGIYDRKSFLWKDVESTVLICACGPPGGGRSALTPRFTRHFNLMSLPNSSEETLSWIFSTIIKNFFKHNNFKPEIIDLGESNALVNATL